MWPADNGGKHFGLGISDNISTLRFVNCRGRAVPPQRENEYGRNGGSIIRASLRPSERREVKSDSAKPAANAKPEFSA